MTICPVCKIDKDNSEFYKSSSRSTGIQYLCKKCSNIKVTAGHKIKYDANPEKYRKLARERYKLNQVRYSANNRARAWQRKVDTLTYYSGGTPTCNCCGEKEIKFLTIDHINGLSVEEKKHSRNRGGHTFYSKLKKQGYPSGYQVLCYNCNCAKGFYGQCPHRES